MIIITECSLCNNCHSPRCENSYNGDHFENEEIKIMNRLKELNFRGIIILDETWVSVSADEKMINLIKFLNHYVDECDIQVLFITHRAEMFGKNANSILQVSKNDGIANVKKVSFDDIIAQRVDV